MFQLIDTLYITEPETQLWAQDDSIVIQLPDGVKTQIPSKSIHSIVCFYYTGLSSSALHYFVQQNIPVYFLRPYGEDMAQFGKSPVVSNLWQLQRETADKSQFIHIVRQQLIGRTINCRNLLQKAVKSHREDISKLVLESISQLQSCCRLIQSSEELTILREIGKKSDAIYAGCLNELIINQRPGFTMEGKETRSCSPRFFALRSFIYTLLTHDIAVSLEACGLNPSIGFLHHDAGMHDELTYDMLSEFGPVLADRTVFSLINLKQVSPDDFIFDTPDVVRITEGAKRNIINSWQKRKQETLTHTYLNVKITAEMISHLQGVLLTRYLRQEIDGYPPFIIE